MVSVVHVSQLETFKAGGISPYIADLTIEMLKNATNSTHPLYGGDIVMTLEFAKVVLKYESEQTGLNMISQQFRDFVQVKLSESSFVTIMPRIFL